MQGDCDRVPKVAGAGEVFDLDGRPMQRMHNGLLVDEGCYWGPWLTAIIRSLRGHLEPQEELAFHQVIQRLAASEHATTMFGRGSFWAYHSLWFVATVPHGRVIALEPDPVCVDVGRRNFALKGRRDQASFVQHDLQPPPRHLG